MIENFNILDSTNDYKEWKSFFDNWDLKEPFAHPSYCSLFSDFKTVSKCAILNTPNGSILYPFLLRNIEKEEYATNIKAKDIISPYGYSGLYKININEQFEVEIIQFFNEKFRKWMNSENVVTEVIKFHLFEEVSDIFEGVIEIPQQNIAVDLTNDIDSIWMNFDHKVRKNVNKANNNNLKFIIDKEGKFIEDFINIYESTLKRRSALDTYFFNLDFFKKIIKDMENNFCFFHILNNDKIISTELCLLSKNNIYSFLGGTYQEYFNLRPNDLLKFEIIKWGVDNNKNKFILGGGYTKDDGIFNYKKSFEPLGVYDYKVGSRIINNEIYNELIESKREFYRQRNEIWIPKSGFIPEYRT